MVQVAFLMQFFSTLLVDLVLLFIILNTTPLKQANLHSSKFIHYYLLQRQTILNNNLNEGFRYVQCLKFLSRRAITINQA